MRVCFPVQKDKGFGSTISDRFASAPIFVIVDTELNHASTILNCDPERPDSGGNPFKALRGRALDGIVADGVGDELVLVMNMAGLRLFQAISTSLTENLELFMEGRLPELQVTNANVDGRYFDAGTEVLETRQIVEPLPDRHRQR